MSTYTTNNKGRVGHHLIGALLLWLCAAPAFAVVELDKNSDGKVDDEYLPLSIARKSDLAGKQDALGYMPENPANKGVANGYAALGADGKVPSSQLPAGTGGGGVTSYNDLTDKPTIPTALSQLAGDANHRSVTDADMATWSGKQNALGYTPEDAAKKGAANGYAALGADGKVPSSQLPAGTGAGVLQGDGIILATDGTVSVDAAYVQRRIGAGCAPGAAINSVSVEGSVTCEAVGGDLTGSWTGMALSGQTTMHGAIQALGTAYDNGINITAGTGITITESGGTATIGVLSGAYQPASASLTTAAGIAGASKYYGTNAVGAVGVHDLPAGGSSASITQVASDPVDPPTGSIWFNTSSHTLSFAAADGVTRLSGTFTPRSGSGTQILRPIAQTGGNNWINNATGIADANGYQQVADAADATGMRTYAGDMSQRFSFPEPACTSTISKITLHARGVMTGSAAVPRKLRLNAYYNATNHTSSTISIGTAVTEITQDYAVGPSGSNWTAQEIAGNSFGFRSDLDSGALAQGVNEQNVVEFWLVVSCD
ncbi:MAG: hypothetical protein LBD10_14675 [Desulfobulbus sp.]|jgi:hypothetical protein|uniref:hypothetical protein n=1 Tax=Desulfobulbus sp. TaxID=895 RepID=UPI00284CA753|nr:hypothetical protein [Desulfobulbus sp.]MDR2551432.1 hypothetical protein [Desulfobulbus sp.]